jgi:DNA-binding protein HU-beta
MATISKTNLVDSVSVNEGITKADAKRIIDSLFDTVKTEVANGNTVTVVGFGSWTTTHRPARKGRNPQTGAVIDIPAKDVVKHKVKF